MWALLFLPLESSFALYFALFGILIFSGIGLPIPEEVTLLLGGYLAYLEFVDFWAVVYVLIVGIVAADVCGYFLGRFAGDWITRRILSRSQVALHLLEKTRGYFNRYGEKMVMGTRPLLGVRVAVPLLAGHFKMNFARFFFYDIIAAIPWTFFLVSVSYYLGSGLDLITDVREVKYAVVAVLGAGIVGYAFWFARIQGKNKSGDP